MTTTAAVPHRMFAERTRRRVRSPVMYGNRHHQAAAWPELEAWLGFLAAGDKAVRTREQYERDCAQLLFMWPDVPYVGFTDAHILPVLAATPAASRHLKKAALNGWFKWGYRTRRLTANPADLLPDYRPRRRRDVTVFEATEVAALRALPFPHGQLMTILLETGIRRTEATSLTAQRVDFRRQQMLVKEGAKGRKEREVPLTAAAAGALNELLVTEGMGPRDHFWSSHPGGRREPKRDTPIVSSTFQRWWRLCLDEAEVDYRKPHTTRHTFATYWLDGRLDDGDVQRMLGHESIRTTRDIYDHRTAQRIGDRMRRIESGESAFPQTPTVTTAEVVR